MRNYLLFKDFLNKNNSKNINNIYLNCKKTYLNHKNKLNNLKQNLKEEEEDFKNALISINNDFKIYKNDLNNTDLPQQYKTIINNTDDYYLNRINKINYTTYSHKIDTQIFLKILKKIFKNLENHNNRIFKLSKSLNNIDKNKLNTSIYNIILNKNKYDSNLNNNLNSLLYKNSYTLNILLKKIKNITNIINKNKIILHKLKTHKNNINNSTYNNLNLNNIHLLNIIYTNSLNNHELFIKKLHIYYNKLDNITNNLDKNKHKNITNNTKSAILLNINNLINSENKTNIIKLLKKLIFKNSHNNYINKFKILINKVEILKN